MKDYNKIVSIISQELLLIDEELAGMVNNNKNFLTDSFLNFLTTKSKKIRSAVTILAIKSFFNKVSPLQIKCCALVELIHNATLIHDDIIDNSDLRRGKSTYNNLYGDKVAVIAGDYLLSIGLKTIADINNNKITELFAQTLTNVCNGEINQLFETKKILSIQEYLKKSEQKTAELFKLAMMSAFIAEHQDDKVEFAEKFCENFGLAFQIYDDLLDLTGDNKDKPHQSDFKNGTYTAPFIYYFAENKLSEIDENLTEKVKNSTAINKTQDLCNQYLNKALDLTAHFSDNQYVQSLRELCILFKKGE